MLEACARAPVRLCVVSGFMGKEENMKQRPRYLWKQFPAICFREPQAGNSPESYQNNDSLLRKLSVMLRGGCGGGKGTGSHVTPKYEKPGQGREPTKRALVPQGRGASDCETLPPHPQ